MESFDSSALSQALESFIGTVRVLRKLKFHENSSFDTTTQIGT